jgi:DNA-binding MarR family transcriptional regulator
VRARGFDGLRHAHGYVVQRLIEGERPVGALAAELGVSRQAVSKSVTELERLGYVARRPAPATPGCASSARPTAGARRRATRA